MNQNPNSWKKTGGYILLTLTAVALLIGWRSLHRGPATAVDPAVAITATNAASNQPFTSTANDPIFSDDLPVLQDASLAPALSPHTYQGQQPNHDFQTYVVERGDTPIGIAEKFGIRTETILGGNPQLSEESSLLQTGVEIIILPVDGVLHYVQPGDSLESVANLYGVAADVIVDYAPNNLEFPYRLYPETQVVVPGAVRELFVWTPPTLAAVRGTGSGVQPLVVGTGSFIFPVNSRNYTQYYWVGHPGLDIAVGEGTAVYASDTGTVTYAGWNIYGYGNLVVVNHGNGYETFYAHLSSYNVVPGQVVSQGQVVGASGNTGNSSGPHLHFEIRINGNRDDPCWHIGC